MNLLKLTFCWVFSLTLFAETLPPDWYQLPEDVSQVRPNEKKPKALTLEQMMELHVDVLDKYKPPSAIDRHNWNLSAMDLTLSLSLQGTLGILVAKGKATSQIYWRPVTLTDSSTEESGKADFVLRDDMSEIQIEAQIDQLTAAAMATGRIKDEKVFRKSLRERVKQFREMTEGISYNPGYNWWTSKLRMDFGVKLGGFVVGAGKIGTAMRMRFEYEPSKAEGPRPENSGSRENKNLKKVARTLASQLQSIPLSEFSQLNDLKFNSIKVGLGLFAKGKIGIAKAEGSVTFYMYFKPQTKIVHPIQPIPGETLPLIADTNQDHRAFARDRLIEVSHEVLPTGKKVDIYKIPQETFLKGMRKAAKISQKMMSRAQKGGKGNNWEVYQTKTEFALSLTGDVGVLAIGGQGSLQIVHKK